MIYCLNALIHRFLSTPIVSNYNVCVVHAIAFKPEPEDER